jgi:hypothetical protein
LQSNRELALQACDLCIGFGLTTLARERNRPLFFELNLPSRQQVPVDAETVGDGSNRATLLDDLLNGFDFELATMLSGGLAHGVIILAEPHDSNLGVHFSGVRSGFKIPYTSASEEGQVWVRRVNHGPQVRRDGVADNSIFIVFHGAKTN